jgi:hypothetical protein
VNSRSGTRGRPPREDRQSDDDCGHACCHIRTNGYHVHAHEPSECERCASDVWPRIAALTAELIGHGTGAPLRPVVVAGRDAPSVPGGE